MSKAFVAFGPSHLAAIGLSFLLPLALALLTRGVTREKIARTIRHIFATLLIATWGVWYWLIASRGWASMETLLPMQLCDWAGFAVIAALILRSERAYELGYFWSLSGTLQAQITPELFYDFPDPRFVVFFSFHGGVIGSVLYLTFACGMRPKPSSLPRVALWSLGYFVTALAANKLFGTNFGYLSAKPARASLLDLMAPWPYYLVELVALGAIYILVLYAPFFVADMLRGRRIAAGRERR